MNMEHGLFLLYSLAFRLNCYPANTNTCFSVSKMLTEIGMRPDWEPIETFEEDKRKSYEAGMNGHLAKPIEIPKLMEVLASILKSEQ